MSNIPTPETLELAPGLRISRVLTGLWQIADMERDGSQVDPDEAARAMQAYTEAGFHTFDMADHYGSAELIAGHFRRHYAADGQVQLFTKWVPQPGPASREQVQDAVQLALDRLQSTQLDLLQFHAWNYADPRWLDQLFWLDELREQGLIRHLGLTNFDTAHLRIVLKSGIPIVSNQVCYSLIDRRAGGAMAALCQEHGLHLLAFGTVAGGFLSERWLDQPEPRIEQLPNWSLMKYKRFIDAAGGWAPFQHLLRTLHDIARRHGVSIANVACRHQLDQPAVGGIIIGARLGSSQHIDDNLQLFRFQLDEQDRQAIRQAQEGLAPIPGDCGDEYRRPPFLTASGDLSHHLESFPAPYELKTGPHGRQLALSGTIWEDLAGFSRAIRQGKRFWVSGTTATHGRRLIGGQDPAAQMHFIIDKIEGALQSLGARLEDVTRTRIFVNDLADWEAVARAHGERFGHIQPANTLVQAGLVGEGYLVEMEVEGELNR